VSFVEARCRCTLYKDILQREGGGPSLDQWSNFVHTCIVKGFGSRYMDKLFNKWDEMCMGDLTFEQYITNNAKFLFAARSIERWHPRSYEVDHNFCKKWVSGLNDKMQLAMASTIVPEERFEELLIRARHVWDVLEGNKDTQTVSKLQHRLKEAEAKVARQKNDFDRMRNNDNGRSNSNNQRRPWRDNAGSNQGVFHVGDADQHRSASNGNNRSGYDSNRNESQRDSRLDLDQLVKQVCYSFAKGRCTNGDNCNYNHDAGVVKEAKRRSAIYFKNQRENKADGGDGRQSQSRANNDQSGYSDQSRMDNDSPQAEARRDGRMAPPPQMPEQNQGDGNHNGGNDGNHSGGKGGNNNGGRNNGSKDLCRDYQQGVCNRGSSCRFSHSN
jgi:hypothetical protein